MSLIVGGKSVRRRIRRNHFYFVIILILFASIGVGYAALTSTISINGTTQITSAKWDVHFANVTKGGNSVGAASATLSDNNTTLTVSGITLSSPGSEYEVYVNVVNGGTIDANLSSLVKSGLSPAQQQYLSYNVTYAFNRPIKQNDLLKAGSFETLRISIKYNDNKSNAPSTSQSIGTMTFKLNYVQDKGTGVARAKLCKRATTLHSGTVGSTTVNFGQIGTTGTLASGDAFDCDVNGDGVVDDNDIVAVGATNRPNLIYGLGLSVKWKGLDVNLHFQGAGKSQFFLSGKCIRAFSEGQWGNIIKGTLDNRWVDADTAEKLGIAANEDPNATFPRLSYTDQGNGNTTIYAYTNNYRNSTYWLRDGSYVRLKTVDIGYTLPKALVNKIHFNNVRIFLTGTNLLTWSSFKLWDPEMGSNNGEKYPLSKSVTLGLSVNL